MPQIQGLDGSRTELRLTWLKNDTTTTAYKIAGALLNRLQYLPFFAKACAAWVAYTTTPHHLRVSAHCPQCSRPVPLYRLWWTFLRPA